MIHDQELDKSKGRVENLVSYSDDEDEVFKDDIRINITCTNQAQFRSQNHVSNLSNPYNPYARSLSQPTLTQENNGHTQLVISEAPAFFDHL